LPTVTVIIPMHNAAKWISRALESVLTQTLQDIEVIVVDDGSTDESPSIASRYPVRLLQLPQRRGQAAALNAGVARASAPFTAFLDADDLWAREKLARCVAALRANPDALLCYTNGYAVGPDDARLWPLLPPGHAIPTAAHLLMNCVINCPSQVVVRTTALTRFSERLQSSSDHDQWLRIRERGSFIFLEEPLSFYRKHPEQQSQRRRVWEEGSSILWNAYRRYPYSLNTVRKRFAVIHYRLGEFDLNNGATARGLLHLGCAGVLDPVRAVRVVLGKSEGVARSRRGVT